MGSTGIEVSFIPMYYNNAQLDRNSLCKGSSLRGSSSFGTSSLTQDGFQLRDAKASRPFRISSVSVGGREIEIEERIVSKWPFANLIALSPRDKQDRIFLIPPLAGAFPVLFRDLVIQFLRNGAEVAIADWFDASYVPQGDGQFALADEVRYIVEMIDTLGPDLHVVAVCQAVVPALAAAALFAAHEPGKAPRSLVLIGGPVDPLANPTAVVKRLRSYPLSWFERNLITPLPAGVPGEGRLVYPKELQQAVLTGYLYRHFAQGRELLWKFLADDGTDPRLFSFPLLVSMQMDLPAEHYLENICCVFHNRDLPRCQLRVAGEKIDLAAIRATALMTVEGAEDDIAAPGQTWAAHDLCKAIPSQRRGHLLVDACGHFSLFHGRICETKVVPAIFRFLRGQCKVN